MSTAAVSHQQKFFSILRDLVPANISLADEIGSVLGISLDSAYRRLRCETSLTLDEVVTLCHHFNVPLESLNQHIPGVVTFRLTKIQQDTASFREYIGGLLEELEYLQDLDNTTICFAAEDVPIFHHFKYRELTAFKFFYWMKSIQNTEGLENQRFEPSLLDEELLQLGRRAYAAYTRIPSVEVWSDETITSTLKQIRFYWDAGFFRSEQDALQICAQLREVIEDVHRQTETGYKLSPEGNMTSCPFTFYGCDLMIGTNCVLLKMGDKKATYISYHTFNAMRTNNIFFNEQNERWMNNLIRKSTLLSGVAEKQRNQFFKELYKRIDALQEYLVSG